MNSVIFKSNLQGCLIGFRRLSSGYVNGIACGTKRRDILSELCIQIFIELHEFQLMLYACIHEKDSETASSGENENILALRNR